MTLIQQYIHAIYDEEDAFWDYIEILKSETNTTHKALWVAIATDELQHYGKIKDVLKTMSQSEMETAFLAELCEKYDCMRKCLEQYK